MIQTPLPEDHVDDEILAAFLDGTLEPRERSRAEAHISLCDRCREVVAESVRFLAEEGAKAAPVRLSAGRRWRAVSIAAAVAAGVVVGFLVRGARARPEPSRAMAELLAAIEGKRPVQARLAGAVGWAAPPAAARGTNESAVPTSKLLTAAALAKAAADAEPTPKALAALGVAHLALGDDVSAVSALERAAAADPHDADILIDLSAAYLERGDRSGGSAEMQHGLESAEAALQVDPRRLEAWFNRALALEMLGRTDLARKAWGEYLERDATSEWAQEARRRRGSAERGR